MAPRPLGPDGGLLSGAEATLKADPELVAAWVRGWARAREVAPPEPHADGHRVEVGWPDQVRRYVFPSLSEEIGRLGETIHAPWIYLKACAPPEAVRAVLPPRWSVADATFLMTLADLARPAPLLPAGYSLAVELDRVGSTARVRADDQVAASGRMAIVDDLAVFDRIVTDAGHRRRGLGTVIMAALGHAALDRGGRRAALVATDDGRKLYESMGWRLHALYTSAVIPGSVPT